jgi:hypothetical protein
VPPPRCLPDARIAPQQEEDPRAASVDGWADTQHQDVPPHATATVGVVVRSCVPV